MAVYQEEIFFIQSLVSLALSQSLIRFYYHSRVHWKWFKRVFKWTSELLCAPTLKLTKSRGSKFRMASATFNVASELLSRGNLATRKYLDKGIKLHVSAYIDTQKNTGI